MKTKNKVFIATSLDGKIADKNGNIEWLHSIPNPDLIDMGYGEFMSGIDALVMGRTTFETVCGFEMDWPYDKPVFVLSNRLTKVPKQFEGKAEIVNGALKEILTKINGKGYNNLYIDGGKTIQSFLNENLIDEMTITIIPYILGGGTPLFTEMSNSLEFKCVESKVYLDKVVQNKFIKSKQ